MMFEEERTMFQKDNRNSPHLFIEGALITIYIIKARKMAQLNEPVRRSQDRVNLGGCPGLSALVKGPRSKGGYSFSVA